MQSENAIEGIVEVQEELNKFERSLETTKKIIRQLINDTFYMITQQIRTAIDLVNVFESSLETIDEDIRLLIRNITEANPNETETLKNYVSCQSQAISEEYHNQSIEYIDNLDKEIETNYPNNFRRAIKMLSKRKGIQQLIFNTSQSEKSNMTCNSPENISEDDFNKLQDLLRKKQRTDLASTYIKLKKKALLLVWED
uniref:Uncharacterized protein n=1 Tax=Schistosoma japonicum TaxID=6182 RepID=Q5DBK0_SCHJA|nr:unknown [Schistosoma japonicum]